MLIERIEFCKGRRCCPEVHVMAGEVYAIGGPVEGVTIFTKQNFQDFVTAAKEGKFDAFI